MQNLMQFVDSITFQRVAVLGEVVAGTGITEDGAHHSDI